MLKPGCTQPKSMSWWSRKKAKIRNNAYYLNIYISIYLFIYISIYLYVYLSIYLSIYIFIIVVEDILSPRQGRNSKHMLFGERPRGRAARPLSLAEPQVAIDRQIDG